MNKAPLEKEIRETCEQLANFLVEKNTAYGNSAAEPIKIFAKRIDALGGIDVRIDDKLNRLLQGHEFPGDDTVWDLVGYLVLRIVVKDMPSTQATFPEAQLRNMSKEELVIFLQDKPGLTDLEKILLERLI